MQYTGIIGNPLGHSLSPVFQQAAFDHMEIEVSYELLPTEPSALENRVNSLRSPEFLGANVTIPYKTDVIPLLDDIDGEADLIGAVNTIANQNGKLTGYNTDSLGFMKSLSNEAPYSLGSKHVLVVGAGGSARAVLTGVLKEAPSRVVIANRSIDRAMALKREIGTEYDQIIDVIALDDIDEHLGEGTFDLVVNCTPMGMKGTTNEKYFPPILKYIGPNTVVHDLVYNPRETPLISNAKNYSNLVFNGLEMLIQQGAASFKIWTGNEAPIEIMREAVQEKLYN